jgi:hypothetical protein
MPRERVLGSRAPALEACQTNPVIGDQLGKTLAIGSLHSLQAHAHRIELPRRQTELRHERRLAHPRAGAMPRVQPSQRATEKIGVGIKCRRRFGRNRYTCLIRPHSGMLPRQSANWVAERLCGGDDIFATAPSRTRTCPIPHARICRHLRAKPAVSSSSTPTATKAPSRSAPAMWYHTGAMMGVGRHAA